MFRTWGEAALPAHWANTGAWRHLGARGIEVIAGEANGGFAVNANRGLRAADPEHDVVLLNSDVTPLRD